MIGLQNNLGEERMLLGSSFGRAPEGVSSEKSEKCDESITFESCFQFEDDLNDESSRLKDSDLKQSSSVTEQKEQKQTNVLNKFIQKIQSLLTFNRKFTNFKQLYKQLVFDGCMTMYFLKMRARCQKYVETSFKDEQLMREISKDLQKDSFHYYNLSGVGNKCIVWGRLNEWNDFIDRKDGKCQKKPTPNYYSLSSFGNSKEIKLEINNPSAVFSEESSLKTFTKRGILYRLITSLYALNLFKFNVEQGNVQVKFGFVYIFGEKAINSDGQLFIKAQRVFQRINYKNYRRDQAIFSAFGVLVGGIGLYFLSKFLKNGFMCCKKKRLVERVKEFFIKPKKEKYEKYEKL